MGENLSVFGVTKTDCQEPFTKWPLDAPVYKHIIGTAQAGKEAAVFQQYGAALTVFRARDPSMRFAPFRLLLLNLPP